MAEDLTQAGEPRFGAQRQQRGPGPGFLPARRRLETFDNRGLLRPWLHRIAHREFLQALRHQRSGAYGLDAGADSLEALDDAAVPVEWGRQGRRKLLPLVLERTRTEARAAAQQIAGPVREALLQAERRSNPESAAVPPAIPEPVIVPTERDLTFFYFPGTANRHPIRIQCSNASHFMGTGW